MAMNGVEALASAPEAAEAEADADAEVNDGGGRDGLLVDGDGNVEAEEDGAGRGAMGEADAHDVELPAAEDMHRADDVDLSVVEEEILLELGCVSARGGGPAREHV